MYFLYSYSVIFILYNDLNKCCIYLYLLNMYHGSELQDGTILVEPLIVNKNTNVNDLDIVAPTTEVHSKVVSRGHIHADELFKG